MTDNFLVVAAGVIVSLIFSYFPKLSDWYKSLDDTYKRLIMLGVVVLVAVGAYVASCYFNYDFITCDEAGIKHLLELILLAAGGNQLAYRYSPRKA